MANSYTYGKDGTYDQRWSDKEATTTTRLNYARSMADYLREAVETIMSTSAADGTVDIAGGEIDSTIIGANSAAGVTATYLTTAGTYDNPVRLGALRLWRDTSGRLRAKDGSAPGSTTDGSILAAVPAPIAFHPNTATESLTIPADHNSISGGPITIASGVIITLQPGATWVIA